MALHDQPPLLLSSPFSPPASPAGHLYFLACARILPGAGFLPRLAWLNSINASCLSSESLGEVFSAHTQFQAHLLISVMVSCPFPYQILSLIICVTVCLSLYNKLCVLSITQSWHTEGLPKYLHNEGRKKQTLLSRKMVKHLANTTLSPVNIMTLSVSCE